MDLGLKDKKVLVTAASKGLGYAVAKAFLSNGARVIISSSDEAHLQNAYISLKSVGEVYKVKADLTKKEDIDHLFAEVWNIFKGLDVFVYITGAPKPGTLLELEDNAWVYASKLLLLSAVRTAKHAIAMMNEGGRMIFSASTSIREPIENLDLSNVIRITIAGLVKTLATELGPRGILVNSVLPGYINTERIKTLAQNRAKKQNKTVQEVYVELSNSIPLRRIADPEEFANVVLFLASNLATYVTGTSISVDGGRLRSIF